jgi:hypothetical protein
MVKVIPIAYLSLVLECQNSALHGFGAMCCYGPSGNRVNPEDETNAKKELAVG